MHGSEASVHKTNPKSPVWGRAMAAGFMFSLRRGNRIFQAYCSGNVAKSKEQSAACLLGDENAIFAISATRLFPRAYLLLFQVRWKLISLLGEENAIFAISATRLFPRAYLLLFQIRWKLISLLGEENAIFAISATRLFPRAYLLLFQVRWKLISLLGDSNAPVSAYEAANRPQFAPPTQFGGSSLRPAAM